MEALVGMLILALVMYAICTGWLLLVWILIGALRLTGKVRNLIIDLLIMIQRKRIKNLIKGLESEKS